MLPLGKLQIFLITYLLPISDQLRENRPLDELKGLKEELDATKIRCEETFKSVQIRLSKLLEEYTALKIDNLEKQRKLVLLLQINEEKDAEIEDQKTQISSLVKTIVEAGGAATKEVRVRFLQRT